MSNFLGSNESWDDFLERKNYQMMNFDGSGDVMSINTGNAATPNTTTALGAEWTKNREGLLGDGGEFNFSSDKLWNSAKDRMGSVFGKDGMFANGNFLGQGGIGSGIASLGMNGLKINNYLDMHKFNQPMIDRAKTESRIAKQVEATNEDIIRGKENMRKRW